MIAPRLADHLLRQYRKASRGETERLHHQLSTRELEILRLVAQGDTDRWIAEEIYVSPRTVQNDLERIRNKTGLRRRSELTRWAVVHGVYWSERPGGSRQASALAASWPHAASMSRPRVRRTVARRPCSSSAALKASIAPREEPA